jgi:hypothetical protein
MTAVDGVLDRLEGMVVRARSRADRRGYFACLYWHFAHAVRRGLHDGLFEHPQAVRALVPELAERYFLAHRAVEDGAVPAAAWRAPLRATARSDLTLGQHLLAAANAHLNLDLPIALAGVVAPAELPGHRDDVRRLRALAAAVLAGLEGDPRVRRRALDPLNGLLRPFENRMMRVVLDLERERAWTFAREIAGASPERWRGLVSSREVAVSALGRRLLRPSWPLRLGVRLRRYTQLSAPGHLVDVCYLGVDADNLIRAALAQARRVGPRQRADRLPGGTLPAGTGRDPVA